MAVSCRFAVRLAFVTAIAMTTACSQTTVTSDPSTRTATSPEPAGGVPVDAPVDTLKYPVTGSVYVPVYSHVFHGSKRQTMNLTALLSIRNTDPERSILVRRAAYYGSDGKLVRQDLEKPLRLDPLASTQVVVPERDTAGGAGACFLVEWRAEESVSEPLIECVMIGTLGGQGISFVCPGRPLKRDGESVAPR